MVPFPDKRPSKPLRRSGTKESPALTAEIPSLGPLFPGPRQAALKANSDQLRALFENSADLVTLLDSAGRIVYAAPSFERALGWKITEVIGLKMAELAHVDDRGPLKQLIAQAQASAPRPFRGEVRATARGGSVRVLEVTLSSRLADPVLGVIICNATDVTAQKELHARLIVSDRMASLGALAASVAHEINNPLAALIGNLQMLSDDLSRPKRSPTTCDGALTTLLSEAQEAAERVRTIARDLNLFSRREQDCCTFIDIQRLLDSSLRMSRNELRHRARVIKHYEPVPLICTNEARLGQVFVNLLVNAAQAIPEGRADENEVRVSTRVDRHGQALVEISDTGGGIEPELLSRVFDPFFTTKPGGQGTGLGLAICRRILAEMGGSITVTSTLGRGSTFSVTLPLSDATDEPVSPPDHVPTSASKRGKVIVIDDEALVRSYVTRALEDDHDVIAEGSATQALARIRRGARFDAIVCDVMMPEVTGIDFYEQLSTVAPEQASRVIFLTGGAFSARARRFLETTENPVVEKPFEQVGFRSIVNRIVG